MNKPKKYLEQERHLPEEFKDFHDQKDLFKTIHKLWLDDNELLEKVNWVDAHCYTIDFFLWFMALNGYKLQKIKSKQFEFYDLQKTIENKNFTFKKEE